MTKSDSSEKPTTSDEWAHISLGCELCGTSGDLNDQVSTLNLASKGYSVSDILVLILSEKGHISISGSVYFAKEFLLSDFNVSIGNPDKQVCREVSFVLFVVN